MWFSVQGLQIGIAIKVDCGIRDSRHVIILFNLFYGNTTKYEWACYLKI